jgi:hypothetical protein
MVYSYIEKLVISKNWDQYNCCRRNVNKVQKLLSVSIVVKIVQLLTFFVYYLVYSKIGNLSSAFAISKDLVSVCSDTTFLAILLLVAMGMC